MKLTTKLLLGATVVAGLSMSAFAACATDVDFGGSKKITGLVDGTQTGESVHYGQVFTKSEHIIDLSSDTNLSAWSEVWIPKLVKQGKQVCTSGIIKTSQGSYTKTFTILYKVPVEFRPVNAVQSNFTSGSGSAVGRILIYDNGDLAVVLGGDTNHYATSFCYLTN